MPGTEVLSALGTFEALGIGEDIEADVAELPIGVVIRKPDPSDRDGIDEDGTDIEDEPEPLELYCDPPIGIGV
jgi:hypothetical protein